MSYFSKNLRYLRGEYSQQVIVNRINRKLPEGTKKISQQRYNSWEKGNSFPHMLLLPFICEALDIDSDDLMSTDMGSLKKPEHKS
jgi:transcriptional regulator with XRE-family HTH domain